MSVGADGRLLMHCHGGCSTDAVLAALELRPADLFPDRGSTGGNFAGFVDAAKRMKRDQPRRPQPPAVNFLPLAKQWHAAADLSAIADTLGVSIDAMTRMRAGRVTREQLEQLRTACPNGSGAWAFPMRCHDGRIIGIRTRFDDGTKRAVTGSRQGLFFDPTLAAAELLHVVEGCSDTAAMLTLGFDNVVGMPSAGQGADLLALLIQRIAPPTPRCILIADRDGPGLEGMRRVARQLARWGIRCRVTEPPGVSNDVRAYLNAGGDAAGVHMLAQGEAEEEIAA
ncbi:MAG: hypothetical protein AAGD32_06190 [Planctomycetota bacterium]